MQTVFAVLAVIVDGVAALLKVTLIGLVGGTPVAPSPGLVDWTKNGVGIGVLVGMFVGVFLGPLVGVGVGVFVGVPVGVSVGVFVGVLVGVFVAAGVGVLVGVFVGVLVGVFVGVLVQVPVGVTVGVGVGVVGPQALSWIEIVSMRQPVAVTLLSLPMRQRSWMFFPPAAAGRFTVVVM